VPDGVPRPVARDRRRDLRKPDAWRKFYSRPRCPGAAGQRYVRTSAVRCANAPASHFAVRRDPAAAARTSAALDAGALLQNDPADPRAGAKNVDVPHRRARPAACQSAACHNRAFQSFWRPRAADANCDRDDRANLRPAFARVWAPPDPDPDPDGCHIPCAAHVRCDRRRAKNFCRRRIFAPDAEHRRRVEAWGCKRDRLAAARHLCESLLRVASRTACRRVSFPGNAKRVARRLVRRSACDRRGRISGARRTAYMRACHRHDHRAGGSPCAARPFITRTVVPFESGALGSGGIGTLVAVTLAGKTALGEFLLRTSRCPGATLASRGPIAPAAGLIVLVVVAGHERSHFGSGTQDGVDGLEW